MTRKHWDLFMTAGGGIVASDSFNRPSSDVSLGNADTGQTWTALSGTWGIKLDTVGHLVSGSNGRVYIEAGISNCIISVKYPWNGTSNIGLIIRLLNASNYLIVKQISMGYQLSKFVAGVETALGSYTGGAPAANDVIKVKCVDENIIVYVNGTERINASVSDHKANTKYGLFVNSDPWLYFDDFKVEAI
jgi:hypothetical protein